MAVDVTAAGAITIGDVAALDITGECTLSAWFQTDSLPGIDWFVFSKWSGSHNPYLIYLSGATSRSGWNGAQFPTAGVFTANAWHHGGAWRNGSVCNTLLNGVAGSNNGGGAISNGNDSAVIAGANFDGKVAEVAAWSAYLTDDEMTALAKGFSPALIRPQSLAGYWPLFTATPQDLKNGNNGTPSGVTDFDHPRIIH
jgi:hypothetical protein